MFYFICFILYLLSLLVCKHYKWNNKGGTIIIVI